MDEVTKIDRSTGEIIWRMGGKMNQFLFVDDINDSTGFCRQHDIRVLPNGNITLFDNGNCHEPPFSRAVEYEVDADQMTVTKVWEFRDSPDIFSRFMGNAQRLPNGNTMIGWGGMNPNLTEVRSDGSKAFELTFREGINCYRAFRFDWEGVAAAPYLWADTTDSVLSLGFVKFGDENISAFRVYRGDSPAPETVVETATGNSAVITGFDAGATLYFRVTSLDGDGNESPFSNEVEVTPEFSSMNYTAELSINPRTLNKKSHGNWILADITLPVDCPYPATDVDIGSLRLNNTVAADEKYSVHSAASKSTVKVKFARREVLDVLPIGDAVAVKVSGAVGDASFECIDYITVIHPEAGPLAAGTREPAVYELTLDQNLPNPFNPSTVIRYELTEWGSVMIGVYDVNGSLVKTLVDRGRPAGRHEVVWHGDDEHGNKVSSGVYFYRLRAGDRTLTKKMILLK
jgi:hypothetical protein